MRHIVLFCLLSTGAQATIQNVSILGSTATQALIHYTAPNNSPCTVEVSESPTYLPLVNDVDGTKFASASSDSRPGAITNGLSACLWLESAPPRLASIQCATRALCKRQLNITFELHVRQLAIKLPVRFKPPVFPSAPVTSNRRRAIPISREVTRIQL